MEQWRLRAEMAFLIDNLQFYLQVRARGTAVLVGGREGWREGACGGGGGGSSGMSALCRLMCST